MRPEPSKTATGGAGKDSEETTAGSVRLGEPAIVLDTVARAVYPFIIAFGLYLHFAGHNQPGGGFIAGLVIGAALVLRLITANDGAVGVPRLPAEALFGVGGLLVVGTALTSIVLGNAALEHHTWEVKAPVLGKIKWTSAVFFDTGVLLIVVAVVAGMLAVFSAERGEDEPTSSGDGPEGGER